MGKYYWIDTEYNYGDYHDKKFALICGTVDEDGKKDRETEEVILWAAYNDLGIDPYSDSPEWDKIDRYIEGKLGFLPDYEVN